MILIVSLISFSIDLIHSLNLCVALRIFNFYFVLFQIILHLYEVFANVLKWIVCGNICLKWIWLKSRKLLIFKMNYFPLILVRPISNSHFIYPLSFLAVALISPRSLSLSIYSWKRRWWFAIFLKRELGSCMYLIKYWCVYII